MSVPQNNRRCYAFYFTMLKTVREIAKPSSLEISAALGIDRAECSNILNVMRTLGLVKRVRVRDHGRFFSYLWGLGEDSDRTMMSGITKRPRLLLAKFADTIKAADGTRTLDEIGAELLEDAEISRRRITCGRAIDHAFVVVNWARDSPYGPWAQIYKYDPTGSAPDAPKPKPKSRAQIRAQATAKRKADILYGRMGVPLVRPGRGGAIGTVHRSERATANDHEVLV